MFLTYCTSADQMGLVIRLGTCIAFIVHVIASIHTVSDLDVRKDMPCSFSTCDQGRQTMLGHHTTKANLNARNIITVELAKCSKHFIVLLAFKETKVHTQ